MKKIRRKTQPLIVIQIIAILIPIYIYAHFIDKKSLLLIGIALFSILLLLLRWNKGIIEINKSGIYEDGSFISAWGDIQGFKRTMLSIKLVLISGKVKRIDLLTISRESRIELESIIKRYAKPI